jgi:galactose-1-phosphate uridylyltransferase
MAGSISLKQLEDKLESRRLGESSRAALLEGFRRDADISSHRPEKRLEKDPRDNSIILYSTARAKRPHDNEAGEGNGTREKQPECPVCSGNTTAAVDIAPLSSGFSFINRNLFPALYPDSGAHFLQWSSNYHDRDWHNMPLSDRSTLLEQLARLEKLLLFPKGGKPEESGKSPDGYVSIIRNTGAAVGGSLEHGHQQIGWSRRMPGAFAADLNFLKSHGASFADLLAAENPSSLTIREYKAGRLVVPAFMRRPYSLIYLPAGTPAGSPGESGRSYLHDLSPEETASAAEAIGDTLECYRRLLPRLGKEIAFNFVIHSGPGAGLYIEFLPWVQETGGFEHLGMWVCQGSPEESAETLRSMLR